jgi:hypothetical protein
MCSSSGPVFKKLFNSIDEKINTSKTAIWNIFHENDFNINRRNTNKKYKPTSCLMKKLINFKNYDSEIIFDVELFKINIPYIISNNKDEDEIEENDSVQHSNNVIHIDQTPNVDLNNEENYQITDDIFNIISNCLFSSVDYTLDVRNFFQFVYNCFAALPTSHQFFSVKNNKNNECLASHDFLDLLSSRFEQKYPTNIINKYVMHRPSKQMQDDKFTNNISSVKNAFFQLSNRFNPYQKKIIDIFSGSEMELIIISALFNIKFSIIDISSK